MKGLRLAAASLLPMLASFSARAADVYVFDSITRVDLATRSPTIVGVLRNTASPLTVIFPGSADPIIYRSALIVCTPLLLTMMEKPGKYLLQVTYDSTNSRPGELLSCALEIKN